MTSAIDIRRFAYRQGPGKRYLGEQNTIDDSELTTSLCAPARARGGAGALLPLDSHDVLAAAAFPGPIQLPAGADTLGHLLLAGIGLVRREPDNHYNDHRAVASGRARFPVHAFIARRDRLRYLDHYRHAQVDVETPTFPPAPGADATVALAARYTDLPHPYGRLRYAVGEAEIGVQLRAVCVAAQAVGATAAVDLDPRRCAEADEAIDATGPGVWSAPALVDLAGVGAGRPSEPLPSRGAAVSPDADRLLARPPDPSVAEAREVSAGRLAAGAEPAPGGHSAPRPTLAAPAAANPGKAAKGAANWADVLWARSAGRAPAGLWGFAYQPAPTPAAALAEIVAWGSLPPPDARLRAVADRLTTSVVTRGVDGHADGVYRLVDDQLDAFAAGSRLLAAMQSGFGQPPAPNTDSGMRHAAIAWVVSADVDQILDDLGPGALSLLNLCCGWTTHGLCLAAAAHGLAARPARSYDEYHIAPLLGLDRKRLPVFMTVCGWSRLTGPMLDLRP